MCVLYQPSLHRSERYIATIASEVSKLGGQNVVTLRDIERTYWQHHYPNNPRTWVAAAPLTNLEPVPAADVGGIMSIGDRPLSKPMLTRRSAALSLLRATMVGNPDAPMVGDVRACELAMLAAYALDECPKCSAASWSGPECELCLVCSSLMHGDEVS